MMTPDHTMVDCGLIALDGDVDDVARAALAGHALAFFYGGGRVSWSDWRTMSAVTRAAFTAAWAQYREETRRELLASASTAQVPA
jgi:hypothetical protein